MNKTGRSSKRIVLAFKTHASSQIPKNRYDPLYLYYQADFSGESFMLNPHEFLNNHFRYTPKEMAEYIGLASFRSYTNYTLNKTKTLDLFHSPVNQDTINHNRLLRIKDERIYFLYEEDLGKRENIWH